MHFMRHSIPIGISMPKEMMSRIDTERGDISRSRFLLRLIECTYAIESRQKVSSRALAKSNSLEGSEASISSESVNTERNSPHV
jgi:hypothetical protein